VGQKPQNRPLGNRNTGAMRCVQYCQKKFEFDHLMACSDYFAQFLLLKRAFSIQNIYIEFEKQSYVTI